MGKKILIKCPICGKAGRLNLPENIRARTDGTTTIEIPAGLFCMHSFSVYLDQNFMVRDYLIPDHLEVSEIADRRAKLKTIAGQADSILKITWAELVAEFPEDHVMNLITAVFMRSKILFVINDLSSVQFERLFAVICMLDSNAVEDTKVVSFEDFREINEVNQNAFSDFTVYDVRNKLLLNLPFSTFAVELMKDVHPLLEQGELRVQLVLLKNYLALLDEFMGSIKPDLLKNTKKALKHIKSKFGSKADFLTNRLVSLMSEKVKYLSQD